MIRIFCFVLLFIKIILNSVYAFDPLSCPSEQEIKNVTFVKALNEGFDCWDFVSNAFIDSHGVTWNVRFGTFLTEVIDEKNAYEKGYAAFQSSPLIIKNPTPVEVPNHVFICEYTTPGRPYWIGAINPPDYTLPIKVSLFKLK